MIAASELREIPIFACLDEPERQRLAERAADVRLEPGVWLIREGEAQRLPGYQQVSFGQSDSL